MPEVLPLLSVDGSPALAQYDLGEGVEAANTPKPHIHPLRTPGGVVVTDFAPDDHLWHMGLQFGLPWVGEDNFWGGGSYLGPEQGYVVIDNQGVVQHVSYEEVGGSSGAARMRENLNWLTNRTTTALEESRTIEVSLHGAGEEAVLRVDHVSVLKNPGQEPLALGTPAQRGRSDGGYGGLFLRLAQGFEVIGAASEQGSAEGSGHRGRVFIVHGRIDGSPVTLGLTDLAGSEVPDSRWLYRFAPFPAIGWAGMYEEGVSVDAGESVTFAHRLVLADGLRQESEIEALLLG